MAELAYSQFPKEFHRNYLAELDKRFWSLFLITLVFMNALAFYMKSRPVVVDVEKQKKFMKQLYKAQTVTTEIKVQDLAQLKQKKQEEAAAAAEEAKVEKVEAKKAERAAVSDAQRKAARDARRAGRAEKAAALRKAVSQATVFSAAGSRAGGGGGGGRGIGRGPGGTGGGGGGGKFAGIAGDAGGIVGGGASLAPGRKVVSGGAVKEVAGDIDITQTQTGDIEAGELGGGLEMEEVSKIVGKGAENVLRTPETLNPILQAKAPQIRRCFERYKKRDPQLNGRVVISMTIKPDGSVDRISVKSQWSNPTLGAQVDECIRERVQSWRFDAIPEGDVKFELPMSLS
jgi:outer membrane biosynthesis protein TonB